MSSYFPYHYDILNPFTKHDGKIRQLEAKIATTDDPEMKRKYENQKARVSRKKFDLVSAQDMFNLKR